MSDFFANEEQKVNEIKKKAKSSMMELEQKEKPVIIPPNYIPVKLSSLGKLNAPAIIHVKNYDFEHALDSSLTTDDNILETTVHILKGIIYENFDPLYFHIEEIKEILLNIYANFWSKKLREYNYPYEDDELNDKDCKPEIKERILKDKKFTPLVDIEIKNIETKVIDDEFKEPFFINDDELDKRYYFRLSRVYDIIKAKELSDEKFIKEKQQFSDVDKMVKEGIDIETQLEPERYKSYVKYIKDKTKFLSKVMQACFLVKVKGENLDTLEKKMKYVTSIPLPVWIKYDEIDVKYKQFGIDPNVKVISPLTGKEVVRRFQFRYVDFITSLELQDNSRYSVGFGE